MNDKKVSQQEWDALILRVTALERERAVILEDFNARIDANLTALSHLVKGDQASAIQTLEGFYKKKMRD